MPQVQEQTRTTCQRKRKRTYIGVTQQFNRYRARIKINGITHNLGSYDTEKEAAGKYDTEAIKLGRTLNFETEISAVQPTRMSPRNTTGYRGVSKKYETGKLAGNKATIRAREVNTSMEKTKRPFVQESILMEKTSTLAIFHPAETRRWRLIDQFTETICLFIY